VKQDSIKKYVILCVVFILASTLVYAKPKAGFGIIRGFSSEEIFLATLLRQHIINIAASLQIFDSVNPENLARQQQRFACYDEQCMLLFTREMGLSLFVIGKAATGCISRHMGWIYPIMAKRYVAIRQLSRALSWINLTGRQAI